LHHRCGKHWQDLPIRPALTKDVTPVLVTRVKLRRVSMACDGTTAGAPRNSPIAIPGIVGNIDQNISAASLTRLRANSGIF
jgi:hypothetical protein